MMIIENAIQILNFARSKFLRAILLTIQTEQNKAKINVDIPIGTKVFVINYFWSKIPIFFINFFSIVTFL